MTELLRDTPGQTPEQVDRQFRSFERLDVRLVKPLPVYWIYVTAWGTPMVPTGDRTIEPTMPVCSAKHHRSGPEKIRRQRRNQLA